MYTRPEDDREPPSSARPRRMTVYQTREGRPRWVLHMQAVFWRVLMGLGMFFHKLALPRPPKPNFYREIPSTVSGKPGKITLYFYTPKDYDIQRLLWTARPQGLDGIAEEEEAGEEVEASAEDRLERRKSGRLSTTLSNMGQSLRRASSSGRRWGGYPVVINFHGGGFTIGSAHDDARWCGTVVDECHAIVVSVDYRLAPENPFPTAVEDGVDAVLYIHEHAEELGIDKDKIALSGFSSGANMCFTVPLRLYDEQNSFPRDEVSATPSTERQAAERAFHGAASTLQGEHDTESNASTKVASQDYANNPSTNVSPSSSPESQRQPNKGITTATVTESNDMISTASVRMIIPWYPPVDYTRTREQRRGTCKRPDQELPALFTDLFDESYLHPPHTIALSSPYLSPGVAPTSLLRNALPNEIIMHTCEWDMLLAEGEDFKKRLTDPDVGKKVWYKMVEDVPHGWDKAPNPWKPTPGVREHYLRACKEMRRVFGQERGPQARPVVERQTTKGFPTAAERGSIQVVR